MRPPKRLHNFSLQFLKWGNQRFLPCVKLNTQSPPIIQIRAANSNPTKSSSQRSNPIKKKLSPALEHKKGPDFDATRPWNLRTRRAACNAPPKDPQSIESNNYDERLSLGNGVVGNDDDLQVKFSVSLMKDEIEADFAMMLGIRPPRRPKKRPRIVQKQLDSLFPGLWLTEVTPDSYKVPEVVE